MSKLVCIFLRGGADGLYLFPAGTAAESSAEGGTFDWKGYDEPRPDFCEERGSHVSLGSLFGIQAMEGSEDRERAAKPPSPNMIVHKGLEPLIACAWKETEEAEEKDLGLALVKSAGLPNSTRSHFDAMAIMESGRSDKGNGTDGGWLARALAERDRQRGNEEPPSVFQMVAKAPIIQASLNSSAMTVPSVAALVRPDDWPYKEESGSHPTASEILGEMYGEPDDMGELHVLMPHVGVVGAGRRALDAVDRMDRIRAEFSREPLDGDDSESERFRHQMSELATLLAVDHATDGLGIEVACVDMLRWDTHTSQHEGLAADEGLIGGLASAVEEFWTVLKSETKGCASDPDVHLIIMTEFGRRVPQHGARGAEGTDHGHASCMMVMGPRVKNGVHGEWPDWGEIKDHDKAEDLDHTVGKGDLPVLIDYRSVLWEVLSATVLKERLQNASDEDEKTAIRRTVFPMGDDEKEGAWQEFIDLFQSEDDNSTVPCP